MIVSWRLRLSVASARRLSREGRYGACRHQKKWAHVSNNLKRGLCKKGQLRVVARDRIDCPNLSYMPKTTEGKTAPSGCCAESPRIQSVLSPKPATAVHTEHHVRGAAARVAVDACAAQFRMIRGCRPGHFAGNAEHRGNSVVAERQQRLLAYSFLSTLWAPAGKSSSVEPPGWRMAQARGDS